MIFMSYLSLDFSEIFINFFVSLIASTVFVIFILRILRPKIEISDKISVGKEDDNTYYAFKIVNKSIFDAYSFSVVLHRRDPSIVNNSNVNHNLKEIKVNKITVKSLPRYKKDKGYGDHAFQLRTFEDLSKDIDDDNLDYVLSVSVKHGLSNLTKVTQQYFLNSKVFHDGKFKFGSDTGIC